MEEEKNKDNKINSPSPLAKGPLAHTLAEDMTKFIEEDKSGIIKKIITEQEQHEEEQQNLSPESVKNRSFMFFGIFLVIVSVVAIIFIILKNNNSVAPVAVQFRPIIFTDNVELKEISGLKKDGIINTVANAVLANPAKVGGIDGIYLTENKNGLGFRQFSKLMNFSLDLNQLTFLEDSFLLGAFKENSIDPKKQKSDFFILLKFRSITDVFPAMKSWEKGMFYDLHGFFGIPVNADTNYLLTKDFEDAIVANKNARVLKDKDENIVLMYVYLDDGSMVITNSEDATKEIVLRLASSQVKK